MDNNFKHLVAVENAPVIYQWLVHQGGLQVWPSINLSNPDALWETPVVQSDGTPTKKPNWQTTAEPAMTLTEPKDVGVVTLREFKRFRATLRQASNGLGWKLSDASNKKLNKALVDAGQWSTYDFDHTTQEIVVYQAESIISLEAWAQARVSS